MGRFIAEVDRLLQEQYGVSWADASGDDEWAYNTAQGPYGGRLTAQEFVDWFATKYDLIRKEEMYGFR